MISESADTRHLLCRLEEHPWSTNTTSLIRKAHKRLYFLRKLRRAGLRSSVLSTFYRCAVESLLSSCVTVWHAGCTAAEKKGLHRVVKVAQRIVGRNFTTTTDIYITRCRKRAWVKGNITFFVLLELFLMLLVFNQVMRGG